MSSFNYGTSATVCCVTKEIQPAGILNSKWQNEPYGIKILEQAYTSLSATCLKIRGSFVSWERLGKIKLKLQNVNKNDSKKDSDKDNTHSTSSVQPP